MKLSDSWRSGVAWGSVVGLIVAMVDVGDTLLSGFQGQRAMLAWYSLSALLTVGALLGGIFSAWSFCCLYLLKDLKGRWAALLRAFLLGLVGGTFLAWVPSSWIAEHWSTLGPKGTAVAVAVYPAAFVLSTLLAGLTRWVAACYHAGSRPRFHFPLLVGTALFSALSYWTDRNILVGLYDDFHYGLTGAFIVGVAATAHLVVATVPQLRRWQLHLPKRARALLVGSAGASLLVLHFMQPDVFGPSNSVVFAKLSNTGRTWTDLDGDGTTNLFGGSDCSPFNSDIYVGAFDLPGDELDEDCSGTTAQWPAAEPTPEYPIPDRSGYNVLLITVDALRADHLGAWGYRRNPTSPNIDALATRSVRFARAFSPAPKTYDTLPSLVTGLYPSNVPRNYRVKTSEGKPHKPYVYRITDEVKLLAEILQAQGYLTGAGHSIGLMEAQGLDRGFIEYKAMREPSVFALDFLERNVANQESPRPFFLWLHHFSPHHEYLKRDGFDFGDKDSDRYDSEIAHDDSQIGALLRRLSELHLEERTIVILAADHGEEFRDHGGTEHGFKLYRELIHVPLLVAIPGVEPSVVTTPVELADVTPTLCDVLQINDACESHDGHSLLAALAGKRPKDRGAYSEIYRRGDVLLASSLYTEEWHMIYDYTRDRAELYDVNKDESELKNLARKHPELVQQFRDRLAVRTLYRQGLAFQKYQQSQDTLELAKALPIFRNARLLQRVLEELQKDPKPSLAPHLRKLLKRPGLDKRSAKLSNALLSKLPKSKAPKKRKSKK